MEKSLAGNLCTIADIGWFVEHTTQHSALNFRCVLDVSLHIVDRTRTAGFLCFSLFRFFVVTQRGFCTMLRVSTW